MPNQSGYLSLNQHEQSEDTHHNGPRVVLFVFIGLLLGGILRQINKKSKIPYTPMLLLLGMFMGYFRQSLGVVGQSTSIIQQLNPHMILLIFIPVLIFESAFNCNWHVFKKSMLNILILAGPGVLWGAILIGVTFKVLLFYPDQQLTWYQAFTLGSVLSATDPVAVVALLKQLGASVRFNTLVQGQSLLNDGTAMVFFMLFMDLAKGNSSSAFGVLTNFVRVSLGGPLLGIIVGALISLWLKKVIRDHVLSINITFVGAYLCFYIAQFTWVKVSGILSIVVLGLYMSAVGKRKIYPQSEHALHNVWSYVQYSCQTLIFIITGIVVGVQMISQSTITLSDWFKMFLFWILMIIIRFIMVITFYPILKSNGYGLTKKQMVVLIYGGLRGALGLCLSLMVGVDDQLPVRFREITVFYMCGMAVLTIIANGLTCSKVVDYVQMIEYPQIKKKLFQRCVKTVIESTQSKLKQIRQDPDLAYAKWKDVEKISKIRQLGETKHQKRQTRTSYHQIRDSLHDIQSTELMQQLRFRFTSYLSKIYWQLYEDGEVSDEVVRMLSESCDIVNDRVSQPLNYFHILSQTFSMQSVKYYTYFKDITFLGTYAAGLLVQKFYYIYEISIIFIEACEQAEHAFHKGFPINSEHLKNLLDEVKDNVQQATAFVAQIQHNYPQLMQAVQTSRASTMLLNHKKKKLEQMHAQGFIQSVDFQELRKQIDRDLIKAHLNLTGFKLHQIHFSHILSQCPLFSTLTSDDIVKLRMKSIQKTFTQGSKIIIKDSIINNVSVIVSGAVKEIYDQFNMVRGLGNVINQYDFTYRQNSKCVAKAMTDTKIMEIKADVLLQLLAKNQQFRKRWYKNIFIYSVHHTQCLKFLQDNFTSKQLRRFIEASEVKILKQGQSDTNAFGSYIFEGSLTSEGKTYYKQHFISQKNQIKTLSQVIMLKFNQVVGIQFKEGRISVFNQRLQQIRQLKPRSRKVSFEKRSQKKK